MSKKDRIAIVISIPLLLLGLVALFEEGLGIVILLPLFCYWGYRFIKNDISFMRVEEKEELIKPERTKKSNINYPALFFFLAAGVFTLGGLNLNTL